MMTVRTTISLPDDLSAELDTIADLNVSGVCQRALRAELDRRAALAELTDGMERIELEIEKHYGSDGGYAHQANDEYLTVAFTGRTLASVERQGYEQTLYLTKRGIIACYDQAGPSLTEFRDLDDAEGAFVEDKLGLIADARHALGQPKVIELDI